MRITSALLAFALAACGHVNTTPDASHAADAAVDTSMAADASLTFTMAGAWSCSPTGTDCEDIYDFDVTAASMITVDLTAVTGPSLPRLGLFAGTTTSATNLFTGSSTAACAPTQDTDYSQGPTLVSPGHYRVTVGRDWGKSVSSDGTYTVKITATNALSNVSQTSNDTASNQGHCP
jgi:hypothetical protein